MNRRSESRRRRQHPDEVVALDRFGWLLEPADPNMSYREAWYLGSRNQPFTAADMDSIPAAPEWGIEEGWIGLDLPDNPDEYATCSYPGCPELVFLVGDAHRRPSLGAPWCIRHHKLSFYKRQNILKEQMV